MSLLGKRIRRARLTEGLSQATVAAKIGVTQAAVANWELGRTKCSEEQRKKLEKILGPLSRGKKTTPSDSSSDAADYAVAPGVFGAWLRKARNQADLSVQELAKSSGISTIAIYNLENGTSQNPREETKGRLSKALGTSIPNDVAQEAAEGQNIEGLGALTDFDPYSREDRPPLPGVYVFYDVSDRPIYVGKASNIAKRVGDHEDKFWFKFPIVSRASYVEIAQATLRHQIEQILIRFLKSNAVINKQSVERDVA